MLKRSIPVVILSLFSCIQIYAQEIVGIVRDGDTSEPLEGASVYFDNTTIGTTTNSQGEFRIEKNKDIDSPLIISFLGYESISLIEFEIDTINEIYLFESDVMLDEVVLVVDDGWTRAQKLKEFRRHYLGESANGKSCKILNEDDIILQYDKRRKKLTAKTRTPLIIKNRNLQYKITVDLKEFEIKYAFVSKNKKRLNTEYVYYSGANFYEPLQNRPTSRTLERRSDAYKGSVLHFMRSVARENLRKQGFSIYLGNMEVHPRRFIKVRRFEDRNGVSVFLKDRLNIMFKDGRQSSLESFADEFYIDAFGNHSPADQVRFGGDLGKQRMGDSLPLDFLSDIKTSR